MSKFASGSISTIYVTEKSVSCQGNAVPLEHPKVYLKIGESDFVKCPYCRIKFIYQPN